MVSPSYFETFQIDILAGKSFSANRSGELLEVLVNESLAKLLHISDEELIGKEASIPFENESQTFAVIGVVKDYYQQSMRNNIEPCAYINIAELPGIVSSISVRTGNVVGEDRAPVMSLVKDAFETAFPTDVANLFYAEDSYETQFSKDYQFSRIINTITLISIFMTVLGFIGLASNYARGRTREMAIRKVYGANLNNIISLLGAPYLKLMGITFLIAFPLSFYLVTLWLEYFVVKIDLGAWFAFWPILIISAISLLSFSYYVTKVGIQDPAEILKEN
jgi:putative ABC transport system permease protein